MAANTAGASATWYGFGDRQSHGTASGDASRRTPSRFTTEATSAIPAIHRSKRSLRNPFGYTSTRMPAITAHQRSTPRTIGQSQSMPPMT